MYAEYCNSLEEAKQIYNRRWYEWACEMEKVGHQTAYIEQEESLTCSMDGFKREWAEKTSHEPTFGIIENIEEVEVIEAVEVDQ